MGKIFKFNGEDFEVSEPKNCRIKVVGKGLTGDIKIHEATGTYRESVMGWGSTWTPGVSGPTCPSRTGGDVIGRRIPRPGRQCMAIVAGCGDDAAAA